MRSFQHFKTLYNSVEVYLTCKFVTLEENIRQKRSFMVIKRIVFSSLLPYVFTYKDNKFACLIKANFYRIQFLIVGPFSDRRKIF